MKPLQYRVPAAFSGKPVKLALKKALGISSSLLSRLKNKNNGILLNGEPVFVTRLLTEGDLLTVDISDEPTVNAFSPISMPLDIVWEDEYLLILNKPAPLAVHPSTLDLSQPSLACGLAAYLGADITFHPVNRLDRGTTGLMAVAKCGYIHQQLMAQLQNGLLRREYLGIAPGTVQPESGVIRLPIAREESSVIARRIDPTGVYAESHYETLQQTGHFTLLHLQPVTGRTHQLRLHMAAIGYPLAGDWLYGTEDKTLIARPALHSAQLWLRHPITGEEIHCTCPLPPDMQRLLEL